LFLLIVFIVAATLFFTKSTFLQDVRHPCKYTEIVEKYAEEYSLSPSTIFAVIQTESNFRPGSVSTANAMGLMQITEDTFYWISSKLPAQDREEISDIMEPRVNIKYGSFLLRMLFDRFGTWPETYAAYNAGQAKVISWLADDRYSADGKTLSDIPYRETRGYVKKVIEAKEYYEKRYPETAEIRN
jgi:soluble lytic murein transglycosylase